MRETRRVRCPNCGGTVSEAARLCGYCHAPIATVRCGHCYHMSSPDSVHCSGCGRDLGLVPTSSPDGTLCPVCRVQLSVFTGGPGLLHDCDQCGGQFVDHALLRDLLERREVYGLSAPRPRVKGNPLQAPVRYVACPTCHALMSRRNFGGASGIVVDVCTLHGTWFDAGELPRVLAFVEAGGMAEARRRELEALEKKRPAGNSVELSVGSVGFAGMSTVSPPDTDALVEDAAKLAMELFERVASLLRKAV